MNKPITAVEEIDKKFARNIKILDDQLAALEIQERALQQRIRKKVNSNDEPFKPCTSLEAAKKRNKELLRSLEIVKAKIRSNAAYSPTENILEAASKKYLLEPSLVPMAKKLYGPVFV